MTPPNPSPLHINPSTARVQEAAELIRHYHTNPRARVMPYSTLATLPDLEAVTVRSFLRTPHHWLGTDYRATASVYLALRSLSSDQGGVRSPFRPGRGARAGKWPDGQKAAARRVGLSAPTVQVVVEMLKTPGVPDSLWEALREGQIAVRGAARLVEAACEEGRVVRPQGIIATLRGREQSLREEADQLLDKLASAPRPACAGAGVATCRQVAPTT